MATPVQPFVTGPCHFFVGRTGEKKGLSPTAPAPSAFGPLYLGTAERTPSMTFLPGFFNVFNDFTGAAIPMDEGQSGEHGFESGVLTRWSEVAFQWLAAQPSFNQTPGSWLFSDVGTLYLTEETVIDLWMLFPYAQKPAYSSLPLGYHFPAAVPYGPRTRDQLGTIAGRIGLLFHSLPAFSGGVFTHYDFDMTAVQGIPVF